MFKALVGFVIFILLHSRQLQSCLQLGNKSRLTIKLYHQVKRCGKTTLLFMKLSSFTLMFFVDLQCLMCVISYRPMVFLWNTKLLSSWVTSDASYLGQHPNIFLPFCLSIKHHKCISYLNSVVLCQFLHCWVMSLSEYL